MTAFVSNVGGTPMSRCEDCRGILFYYKGVFAQRWCLRCATMRGLARLCDASWHRERRGDRPRWWQWTAYLGYAVRWDSIMHAIFNAPSAASSTAEGGS